MISANPLPSEIFLEPKLFILSLDILFENIFLKSFSNKSSGPNIFGLISIVIT